MKHKIIFIFLFFVFYLGMQIASGSLTYKFEKDYSEGIYAACSSLIDSDTLIYKDVFCIQPPLFYYIQNYLGGGLLSGRIISMMSLLGSLIVVYLITKRVTKSYKIGLLSSLFLLIMPFSFFWFSVGIGNTLMIFFSLLSIGFIVHGSSRRYVIISAITLFLATMTNYTAVIALLAILIYFMIKREYKSLGIFSLFYFVPLGLTFFLLNLITGGEFYFLTLSFHSLKPWDLSQAKIINYFLFMIPEIPILAIAIYSIKKNLISIYFVLILVLGSIIFFRAGSSTHYFLPLEASMILVFGMAVKEFEKCKKVILPVLLIQLFLALSISMVYFNGFLSNDKSYNEMIQEKVLNSQGNVISEYVSFSLNAKKPIFKNSLDPFGHRVLFEHELWNDTILIKEAEENNVTLIIIGQRFSLFPNFVRYLEENYDSENMTYFLPPRHRLEQRIFTR
ncbi:MAG: glycosyltransferase family 39 protein [Candidatus Aenigmatarchaeota archaeon]|nr:MAG: glycosyltransferase family 39 protein [Candidatus Aenigmarchaeota archaeon]